MWKRKITWSRIRRIIELERQNDILKDVNYKLRMDLLVTKNRVGALHQLLEREKQGRPTWNGGAYDVARKPNSASGVAQKGTEEITGSTGEGT